jgi:hypothetical protein
MVEQHTHATCRRGVQLGERVGEVVGAVEALHHHALDPQVVAPDLLDQLGVVHALHEDAPRARDAGLRPDHRAAP